MNRSVPLTKGAALGTQRISDWIYFQRIRRGWSQRMLADRIDVERKTVNAWENGLVVIKLDHLCRIMEVYGVDKLEINISEPREEGDDA